MQKYNFFLILPIFLRTFAQKRMDMRAKILLGWLLFLIVIYTIMWLEHIYYTRNLPDKYRRIIASFTEEEDDDED